jgi:hypothetical protein
VFQLNQSLVSCNLGAVDMIGDRKQGSSNSDDMVVVWNYHNNALRNDLELV